MAQKERNARPVATTTETDPSAPAASGAATTRTFFVHCLGRIVRSAAAAHVTGVSVGAGACLEGPSGSVLPFTLHGVTSPSPGYRGLLRSGAGIAVAMAVMNVSTYAFTVLAAHLLGPKPYGAFASLMATLLVITVMQLGLQATAARRISAEPGHVAEVEAVVLRVTYWAAATFGVVLLLLSPLLDRILRLGSIPTAALVAVAAVPLTVMGGQAGILQGERRWRPLGAVYVAAGVPRLVIGLVLILWSPTETSAMVAVTIAAFAPVLVGWLTLRDPRPSADALV